MKHSSSGFTLIELMIVVVIIAILAGIAFPSYTEHVAKSRRADAKGALMSLAQAMERHYTENGSYKAAAANDADTGVPQIFPGTVPIDGGKVYYNLAISAADDTSYTLTATPANAQVGDGKMTLDSVGNKTWEKKGVTPAQSCWDEVCN